MKTDTGTAELLNRARGQIMSGRHTGTHTGNRFNIYQIAEELVQALSPDAAELDAGKDCIARVLHQRFCDRAAKRVTHDPNDKSSYANTSWEDLPPSMRKEYLEDAEAVAERLT